MSSRMRPGLSRRHLLQAASVAASVPFLGRYGFVTAQTAANPLRMVLWPMMNGD